MLLIALFSLREHPNKKDFAAAFEYGLDKSPEELRKLAGGAGGAAGGAASRYVSAPTARTMFAASLAQIMELQLVRFCLLFML